MINKWVNGEDTTKIVKILHAYRVKIILKSIKLKRFNWMIAKMVQTIVSIISFKLHCTVGL